jgi:hypothetical protein
MSAPAIRAFQFLTASISQALGQRNRLAIGKKAEVNSQNLPENRGAWHMRHETQAINKLDPLARGNETKRSSAVVAGYVLSTLTVAILLADAGVTLFIPTKLEAEMGATGFPMTLARSLGVIEVSVAILYAVPRTAVLGAILLTGFFGGAICAHFRVGEIGSPAELVSTAIGIIAWAGLWFRDARLRELLPLVSAKAA